MVISFQALVLSLPLCIQSLEGNNSKHYFCYDSIKMLHHIYSNAMKLMQLYFFNGSRTHETIVQRCNIFQKSSLSVA
uniref:Putative secreted protein n=1 Tax=Amblyomma cajennense TaxID=34607 RepID=A0A023FBA1_AMBCJ